MNSCLASRISEAKPAIQRVNLKRRCKDGNTYCASWKFRVALSYKIQNVAMSFVYRQIFVAGTKLDPVANRHEHRGHQSTPQRVSE